MSDRRVLILPPTRKDGEVTSELLRRSGLSCVVCKDVAQLASEMEAGAGALLLTDAALTMTSFEAVLAKFATQAAWSDLPVVILCPSEMQSTVGDRIIARLTNVTLLDRPSSARALVSAVHAAIRGRGRQYETRAQLLALQTAEEALRRRERQLETLTENLPDVLSRFDAGLRHTFVNSAVRSLTGFAPAALLGHTPREAGIGGAYGESLESGLRAVFADHTARSMELTFDSPTGLRYLWLRLLPELGESGLLETVLAVTHDVTTSKAAEQQLRRSDRLKDEFLAMLAHELRNPLAPIRNASELLARTLPPDSGLHASVGMVRRQANQLSRLVDDLLDVSRITQGRIELRREVVEICPVIEQALESVEPLIRQRAHNVTVSCPPGPLHVSWDRTRLVQCVANLLNNAAKYTNSGGHIGIETRVEGPVALIRVSDDGMGITEALLPQIFELFVQGDRSLDRSQGGLGIGLSVVQRLVEMHGGHVTAHSEGPGRGAVFELRLPLASAPAPVEPPQVPQPRPGKRVLVVDDNVDAADSLALILKYEGHSATSVYSSADALREAFADFDPHFILLDIGLPGMDGYEVARRLRTGGSTAQLIALTGYGRGEDVRRAKAEGFDTHMVKPVDIPALLQRLSQ